MTANRGLTSWEGEMYPAPMIMQSLLKKREEKKKKKNVEVHFFALKLQYRPPSDCGSTAA